MKKIQFSILLLTTITCLSQKAEQKQRLEVNVDGKTYFTNENDTLFINNKPITIKIAKTQVFDTDKISFEFPNNFSLETENKSKLKIYALDGDDVVISNFVFQTIIETEVLANEMVNDFGKKNCTIAKSRISLNSNTFEGHKIIVTLLDYTLSLEIYKILVKDNQTQLLIFQDTKNDDGSDSSEYKNVIDILNKTFVVK